MLLLCMALLTVFDCQGSSVIRSNANLGVHGQGSLNLTGSGDLIEAQHLVLSLFCAINVRIIIHEVLHFILKASNPRLISDNTTCHNYRKWLCNEFSFHAHSGARAFIGRGTSKCGYAQIHIYTREYICLYVQLDIHNALALGFTCSAHTQDSHYRELEPYRFCITYCNVTLSCKEFR